MSHQRLITIDYCIKLLKRHLFNCVHSNLAFVCKLRHCTTLPSLFATQPALDALNLSNSNPFAFASLEDVSHFQCVITDDCCALIALTALYCLAGAYPRSPVSST